MDYKELCEKTIVQVKKAADFIRGEREGFAAEKIEYKGRNDLVSYVDKQSEKMLTTALSQLLPSSGFICEEGTSSKVGEHYNWIIDPLDGTANFIHGIPYFSVSVGLQCDHEMVLGVIYEIGKGECFYTWKGAPSYLDGKPIHVSGNTHLSDCMFITGFPANNLTKESEYYKSLKNILHASHGVRRFGSAAADLCYTASGRADGFWEYGLHPWDVAAGSLILQNAGGKVCDYTGGDDWLFGGTLIASNSAVFGEFSSSIIEDYK